VHDDEDAAVFLTAAFGERTVHVRRNVPAGGSERAPKSGRVRSVPLVDRAAQVLDASDAWIGKVGDRSPDP
jgi:hypothetical protein